MNRRHLLSLFALSLVTACSAAPANDPTGAASEDLCKGGASGCGPCVPSSTSPTGGTQTCTICGGDSYTKACSVPTIDASFAGQVEIWSPQGLTIAGFNMGLLFEKESGTWRVGTSTFENFNFLTYQSGQTGWGSVAGDDMSITLPIGSVFGTTSVFSLPISTTGSVLPRGQALPINGHAYDPSTTRMELVGEGTSPTGPVWVDFQGEVSGGWP